MSGASKLVQVPTANLVCFVIEQVDLPDLVAVREFGKAIFFDCYAG